MGKSEDGTRGPPESWKAETIHRQAGCFRCLLEYVIGQPWHFRRSDSSLDIDPTIPLQSNYSPSFIHVQLLFLSVTLCQAMSNIKGFVKDGWHPKGKDGGRESWRGDFKGVNQMVRSLTKNTTKVSLIKPNG